MKTQLNEIRRIQQLAGLIKENQASEQGYWDTESTVDEISKMLKSNNIDFNLRDYPEVSSGKAILDLSNTDQYGDRIIIVIKNGLVDIDGEKFDLNENNTLADIINYIEGLIKESLLQENQLKVVDGREILDYDGIYIHADPSGDTGLFITTDLSFDASEFETAGESGEIDINGKIFKWAVLYS